MKLLVSTVVVSVLASLAGCKTKDKYSPSCKRGVSLTAPWTDLKLPLEEGRVCVSDDKRAEMQYLTQHRPEWEQAYEKALVAAGYAKDRCNDMSCTYKKDADKVTVQVIENKSWITVIVRK